MDDRGGSSNEGRDPYWLNNTMENKGTDGKGATRLGGQGCGKHVQSEKHMGEKEEDRYGYSGTFNQSPEI